MERTKQRSPSWKIPFFAVWTGQAFSLVGSNILQFALVWWLTESTGSATVLAMATMMVVLPQVILGPVIGAYVDRWNRRIVMLVADSLVALVALWLAYLLWVDAMQLWHVYVGLLLRTIGGSFHWPAMQASTSLLVPEKHLTRVAGLNQTINGALNVIGPPLGALFLGILPLHGVMLIDVGTALVAIIPLFFVLIPQPERASAEAAADEKQPIWSDLREGLRYVWDWPGMLAIMIMAAILNFVINPAFALMPLLVTNHFGGNATQLGWLESAWGVGLVAGGLLLSTWGGFRRRVYTSLTGLVVQGIGIVLVGVAPANALWIAVIGMLISGSMNALVNGPLFALLQATVAPEVQGRVFTVVMSMSTAAYPLSLAVAGPVADAVGVRSWYVVGGIVCAVIGLGAFFVPSIVHLEENRDPKGAVEEENPAAALPVHAL